MNRKLVWSEIARKAWQTRRLNKGKKSARTGSNKEINKIVGNLGKKIRKVKEECGDVSREEIDEYKQMERIFGSEDVNGRELDVLLRETRSKVNRRLAMERALRRSNGGSRGSGISVDNGMWRSLKWDVKVERGSWGVAILSEAMKVRG